MPVRYNPSSGGFVPPPPPPPPGLAPGVTPMPSPGSLSPVPPNPWDTSRGTPANFGIGQGYLGNNLPLPLLASLGPAAAIAPEDPNAHLPPGGGAPPPPLPPRTLPSPPATPIPDPAQPPSTPTPIPDPALIENRPERLDTIEQMLNGYRRRKSGIDWTLGK